MPLDPSFLSSLVLVLTAFGGAFLAALWISLIIWTYRDIRSRARDPLVQILCTLLVAVLNLPGVIVYLILRPMRTLEEEYQHTLEEESLLQALEELPLCPGCERRVRDDWQVCPNCHTKLKKSCHHCGKLMELPWNICPYCGTPVPGMRHDSLDMDQALRDLQVDSSAGRQGGNRACDLIREAAGWLFLPSGFSCRVGLILRSAPLTLPSPMTADMIAGLKRNWVRRYPAILRLSATWWFYPAALLVLGVAVYGYAWGALGYFWDDWEVVFLLHAKNPALFAGYFAFDRPFAWPYQVMYAVFGLNPLAWHAVTLVVRWGAIVLIYLSLRQVWPRYESYLKWVGALLLLYPGYLQQPISAAYNRHLTAFFVFGLSLFLMVMAVKKPAQAWWLFPLSWIAAFVQLFTIEYFVGLELIRPVLIWLLLGSHDESPRSKRLGRTLLFSLPYLAVLAFYFWWRLVIFPTTISITNYAGDFKLLEDFQQSILAGSLAVLTRAVLDLIYSSFQVWLAVLGTPGRLHVPEQDSLVCVRRRADPRRIIQLLSSGRGAVRCRRQRRAPIADTRLALGISSSGHFPSG